jgi:hypothetical protein
MYVSFIPSVKCFRRNEHNKRQGSIYIYIYIYTHTHATYALESLRSPDLSYQSVTHRWRRLDNLRSWPGDQRRLAGSVDGKLLLGSEPSLDRNSQWLCQRTWSTRWTVPCRRLYRDCAARIRNWSFAHRTGSYCRRMYVCTLCGSLSISIVRIDPSSANNLNQTVHDNYLKDFHAAFPNLTTFWYRFPYFIRARG